MLRLRPYIASDAQTILSWIGDERTFRYWSANRYGDYPITPDDMNAQYAPFAVTDTSYAVTAYDENGIAGHMIMRFIDEERRELRFGFIVADNARRGTGCGSAMLRLALKYAFEILGAERVTLHVFEENEPAARCYSAVGFEFVPEYFHCCQVLGRTCKVLMMEIGKEKWQQNLTQ